MYQLSCRAKARGRGLVPVAPVAGSPDPATAGLDHWTILVHGFNNSEKRAAATWRHTSEQLLECRVELGTVVLFYWPGDYSRSEVVSAMNYPRTVPIAEEAARLLAAYLERVVQDRQTPLQLSFVAHSLGSLVVLETIRLLRVGGARVSICDVLLMAAAVPEGFCVPGEAYGESFSPHTSEVALYSNDDGVLKRFFQIGQEIADRFPEENRRRAVGRSGGPGAGRGRRWTANAHMDGFGHGDYWKKQESIVEIAQVVARANGKSSSPTCFGEQVAAHDALREDRLASDLLDEAESIPPDIIIQWLARPLDPE